jgi:hypothetical protein
MALTGKRASKGPHGPCLVSDADMAGPPTDLPHRVIENVGERSSFI